MNLYQEGGYVNYNALQTALGRDVHQRLSETTRKKGRYPFVPLGRPEQLIKPAMEFFQEKKGRKAESFLDIGCGIGNILRAAKGCGLTDLNGIEIVPEYIRLAKQDLPEAKILRRNMLTWTPDREYDIVYTYIPLCNPTLWEQFLRRFTKVFPHQQLFICVGYIPDFGYKKPGFNQVKIPGQWDIYQTWKV